MSEPDLEKPYISSAPKGHSIGDAGEQLAYATVLTGGLLDAQPDFQHNEFIAARILTYQLLHAEETRTRRNIPFIILVTESVPKEQRNELAKAGAQVVTVQSIFVGSEQKWLAGEDGIWDDSLTKFHAWNVLTDYARVVMLDVNTILTKSLDGIFDLPETQRLTRLGQPESNPSARDHKNARNKSPSTPSSDAAATYLLAGTAANAPTHSSPLIPAQDIPDAAHLSDSLLVFAPSRALFRHYMDMVASPRPLQPSSSSSASSSSAAQKQEQEQEHPHHRSPAELILNYAHHLSASSSTSKDGDGGGSGGLPWTPLPQGWTVDAPRAHDVHLVRSLRAPWWRAGVEAEDGALDRYLRMWRWRMEGFFEAR